MDSSIGAADQSDSDNSIPVTLSTIALDDGTTPEQGDQVEVKLTGTIDKIVNGVAMVKPVSVNGQPIPQDAETPSSTPDEDLMSQAMAHDQSQGY